MHCRMTEPDNPLTEVVASGDGQNGVDPTAKSTTLDSIPMPPAKPTSASKDEGLVADPSRLLEDARRVSARAVNTVMTATYWGFGRRIVEFEQGGEKRAGYGEELVARLAADLTAKFGRGVWRGESQPDEAPLPSLAEPHDSSDTD